LRRCIAVSKPEESHLRKAYALLVSALGQADRHGEAWDACRAGRALYIDDKELLFREAMLHHHFGRLREAEIAYLLVLEGHEERHFTSIDRGLAGFKARHNLAIVYDDMGLHQKSEEQWRMIVDEVPDYLPGWRGLADAVLRQGRTDELQRLQGTLEKYPHLRSESRIIRALDLEHRGDVAGAISELRQAAQDDPKDPEPLRRLSRLLFDAAVPDDVERALSDLVARDPADPAAFHNLGTVYCRQGRFDEAVAAFNKSLALRPRSELTRRQLEFASARAARDRETQPATTT
jgi:tetratricopeptide (TPR) repeat protein